MRWSWLRAVILGALLGPAPVAAETSDLEEPSRGRSIGHAVEGRSFHVWDEDAEEATRWAADLRGAARSTPERDRWRGIAERSAVGASVLSDALEDEIAAWSGLPADAPGISPLGCVLCLLPSLDRTALISDWAMSADTAKRRALARALSAPFQALGVDAVIERLETDRDVRVRELVRTAAAARRALRG